MTNGFGSHLYSSQIMAASTNIPTKLKKSQVVNAGPQLKFDTDTLECLLVKAGSGIPSTTSGGIQYVADAFEP